VKIYREENIPRETEIAKLTQQYQKISGAMTVQFDGKEQTLARMGRIQEEPDRPRREAAWKTVVERRLQDADKLEELFDKLLVLRNEIAHTAGFADFRALHLRQLRALRLQRRRIASVSMTRSNTMSCRSRANCRRNGATSSALDKLRPWWTSRSIPIKIRRSIPSRNLPSCLKNATRIFWQARSASSAEYYHVLRAQELVDLDNRKGKAPGGYQSTLAEARVPLIFMNAVGVHRDVETMLHEAGHAFHALASREMPLARLPQRTDRIFVRLPRWAWKVARRAALWRGFLFPSRTRKRAQRDHLEGIIKFFSLDGDGRRLSTTGSTPIPATTRAERTAFWLSLMDRFGGTEDWSGFERARAHVWHRQLHIFEIPFYYVEYGIAQLGALQLWQASRRDLPAALDHYLDGLSLGRLASAARTFPDQRSRLRLHRQNHRTAHAQREGRAGGAGGSETFRRGL